jgi:membrane protease YdiL (CAAX protease family)
MIYLLVWFGIITLLSIGVFIAGVLALCLKEQARTRAIDWLLILATVAFGVYMSAALLPKTGNTAEGEKAASLDPERKANIIKAGLRTSGYAARLAEPWNSIARIEGFSSYKKSIALAEKEVTKLSDDNPDDDEIDELAAQVKDQRAAFEKVGLQPLNGAEKLHYQDWKIRFIAVAITKLVMLCGSFFLLFKLARTPLSPNEEPPTDYGFRKSYGCILSTFSMQNIASLITGLLIGVIAGFIAALDHKKLAIPNFNQELLLVTVLFGVIGGLISIQLFVCRPAKTNIVKAFYQDKLSWKTSAFVGLGGFAMMSALTSILALAAQLFRITAPSAGVVAEQWIDAVISNNAGKFLLCALFICIMAPIIEEILFRGLLYPWLRRKCGVVAGIALSSVAFGLIHFDLVRLIFFVGLGAILTTTFERTRSLRLTTAMHAAWNVWALLTTAMLIG